MSKFMTHANVTDGKEVVEQYPLVTVVIPNYNHARYLGDAIRSVQAQTYPYFEVIIVDDGSQDDSRVVAATFLDDDRIQYIYQDNQGLSAARNTGIRAAAGAFIGVLDADDMYTPNYLETLVGVLVAQPQATAVFCGYQFVDNQNQDLPQQEARIIPPENVWFALLDGNFLVPESILVRREGYAAAGWFDTTLTACEDWDMWLRLAEHNTILCVPDVLVRHRVLPGSMSSDPIRMLTNRLTVLVKHIGAEPTAAETRPALHRQAYGRVYLTSAVEYLQYGDQKTAGDCLLKMAQVCPTLLTDIETYYELGCGSQPKGQRGQLRSIDIEHNAQFIFATLDDLFQKVDGLATQKSQIETAVYNGLGLLGYNAAKYTFARHMFLQSFKRTPSIKMARQMAATLVKPLLVDNS